MLRATLIELSFLIFELHFWILPRSDSRGEQGGEQVRITSEVIPVANEWGVVGNNGERVFLAPSSYGEVILISSPPESNCILTVWQGSTESTPKKLAVKLCQTGP